MLRGENIICGTTTTGTGTLSLAATPSTVGAIDLDVLARATGIGFGNNAAVLTGYLAIEYTDSTFKTPLQQEKGIGTLTLGSSAGVANATLARTTVQQTATSLNSQPATYSVSAPSAINIGTAANTLIFIGTSAFDIPAFSPYVDTSGTIGSSTTSGAPPLGTGGGGSANPGQTVQLTNNGVIYTPFVWAIPLLAKRVTILVRTAYSGGTPVSNAYARLYDVNSSGDPGKLLYDFGLVGSANASLNSTGQVSSGASGNGYQMTPGDYYLYVGNTLSGGVTAPQLANAAGSYLAIGRIGTNNGVSADFIAASAFTASPASVSATPDDPAPLTSASIGQSAVAFVLKAS